MSTFIQQSVDPDGDRIRLSGYDTTGTNRLSPAVIYAVGATLVYSNTAEFVGTDSFNVALTDALGGTALNTVTVEIEPGPRLRIGPGPGKTLRLAWPAEAAALGFRQ